MICCSSKAKSLILFDRCIHLIDLLRQDLLKTQLQNTKLDTELQGEHRGRTSPEWKKRTVRRHTADRGEVEEDYGERL
jgi:hypothetical protein